MEYLGLVLKFESGPGVLDPGDLVSEWAFYVDEPFEPRQFPMPTYTKEEVEALEAVDVSWNQIRERGSAPADQPVPDDNQRKVEYENNISGWIGVLVRLCDTATLRRTHAWPSGEHQLR